METTQLNLHRRLRDGYDILKSVRDYEKTARKIARFRNHLHFSLHCKHHDVTPVSLKLNSSVKGSQADRILRRAERSLLNVRITDVVRKLDNLNTEQQNSRVRMRDELRPDMYAEMERLVTHAQDRENQECKQRQIMKLKV